MVSLLCTRIATSLNIDRNVVETIFDLVTDPQHFLLDDFGYDRPTTPSCWPLSVPDLFDAEDLDDLHEERRFSKLHSIVCQTSTGNLI